jgi:Tyrosine phosphatase family
MMLDGWLREWSIRVRPWVILASVAGLAAWHVLDFSEARETDFPKIVRPFFNPWPPAAYRLAEPGDTLDRLGLYFASAATALALVAIGLRFRARWSGEPVDFALWPTALALGLAAAWHAATPGPGFDGWHGLGWRAILDPATPMGVRIALGASAVVLSSLIFVNLARNGRTAIADPIEAIGLGPLLAFAFVFVTLRQIEFPGLGPDGYWSRCAFDLGVLAFALALVRARPLEGSRKANRTRLAFAATCGILVVSGIMISTYHRPLARLHAVVPGKIYISGMPTPRGLAIEQSRLHFKTIINLFDEASTQGSPYHGEEIRFVRENGLRYLGSPSDGLESDRFLDETLALAQDPEAWPILIHCHGCMDRSPAWMGLYRFLVEGKPLDEVFREIERHRGSRPKAIVSLQYNRKLPPRAHDRFAVDPTCQLLVRCVSGTEDPFLRPNWNPTATTRKVVTRIEPDPSTRRP